MIKIPVNQKCVALSKALDKVISDYSKIPLEKRKQIGKPEENPKLSDVDLFNRMKTGDVTVAPDVFANYIESFDEKKVRAAAANLFTGNELISISGKFHYLPRGFMGWHSNSNFGGWRVYASYVAEGDKSFFRYYKGGKVITEWEKKGWNFRAFEIKKPILYWHCVYTDVDRFSFGFRFAA